MISFVLDGEIRTLDAFDPAQTVLEWLREEQGRTATKEGCAEGDCGACTVVVGELSGEKVRYRAVNACILFMPMLHGKELVTVESLGSAENLHPVQAKLAECDGSQCGFCTPGFVMSMFAKYQGSDPELPAAPADLLAGNLCRCTGYGPIQSAVEQLEATPETRARFGGPETVALLASLQESPTTPTTCQDTVFAAERTCHVPTSEKELARLLQEQPDATLVSGATDVGLWVTKHMKNLKALIFLSEIDSLRTLEAMEDGLWVGAGVKYSDARWAFAKIHPDLGELIRRIGSVQVRNNGTIGGNIANGSPIGDTMPALITLQATLVLNSADGERRLPLEDFFIAYGKQDLRPGEYVRAVIVPPLQAGTFFRTYKISKRFDQDISAVCAAIAVDLEGTTVTSARIAYGGMAGTPQRATTCEAALLSRGWTEGGVEAAMAALAQDFSPLSDMRASADYRLKVAQNLIRKAYLEATTGQRTRILEGKRSYA